MSPFLIKKKEGIKMSNRVTSIVLKDNQLGNKIKATVKEEREIYVEGKRVPCRIFTASSALHPDFEIIVPNLRNSLRFEGRKEVELREVPNEIILGQQAAHLNYKFLLNNC